MKLNLCLTVRSPDRKYPAHVRVEFTEADLLEWANNYVAQHLGDGDEATDVDIEAIEP